MNRSKRRALKVKDKPVTYTLRIDQICDIVEQKMAEEIAAAKEQARAEARNEALALMFVLPLEVLMDHYWPKSYAKKLPEFTEHLLSYYEQWLNGELDIDKLKDDLWEYGGIRLQIEDE